MPDTNVKIKLSADTKQIRSELKLIDRELQELGSSHKTTNRPNNPKDKNESSLDSTQKHSNTTSKEENHDRNVSQLYKETSILRRELQRLNKNNRDRQLSGGGLSGSSTNANNNSNKSTGVGTPPPNDDKYGKISGVLGKLATATVAIKAVSSAWSSLYSSSKASAAGESLAYNTYGSTLAYSDYNLARKSASGLGSPYGYDYESVMSAGDINTSRAGFTNLDNYNADMNAILSTSKAWGIDVGSMANTSGFMSSIGVTESGAQKKFADLLAESIVQAEMTGREDEQLRVLESISENLASRNTTVTEQSLIGSLGMYNALVAQNENLKGSRGSDIVTDMQNIATSNDSSLDILAGWGTKYTGLAGKNELRRLAEENPEQYWAQVYEGAQAYKMSDDMFLDLMYGKTGSMSKSEDILSSLPEIAQGTYSINDTSRGKSATQDRIDNYNQSSVSTQERREIEKREMSDDRGHGVNTVLNPFRSIYNASPDWLKQSTDMVGWGVKNVALPAIGIKGAQAMFGRYKTRGVAGIFGGGKVTEGFADYVDDIVESVNKGGNTDELLKRFSKSGTVTDEMYSWVDEVTNAYNSGAGNIDDIIQKGYKSYGKAFNKGSKSTLSVSGLSKAGKALGILGTGVEVASGVSEFLHADSASEKGHAVGSTIGSIGGGWGGAAAGAALGTTILPGVGTLVGGILGGLGGGIGGDWLGGKLGSSIANGLTKDQFSDLYDENTIALEENTKALNRTNANNFTENTQERNQNNLYKESKKINNMRVGLFSSLFTSHATGNDYIPYDNYLASLHKGEMVLTSQEADDYRRHGDNSTQVQSKNSIDININLGGSVTGMTPDNQNKIVEVILSKLYSTDLQSLISNGFQRVQNY